MAKILFVIPPYACWGVQVIGTWPPLHIAYLAQAAENAGHEARIFDAMNTGRTFDDIRAEVEAYQPDFVAAMDYLPVTGAISTATVPAALEALTVAKEARPEVKAIISGPHPTFMFEEILLDPTNTIDFVLRGEAEVTIAELINAVVDGDDVAGVKGLAYLDGGEVLTTETRPHIEDLNPIKPAWHLLDWSAYHYNIEPWGRMASMLTSRGCMMGCSFCSHRQFWRGTWRARDPKFVIEEMRELVEKYEVEFITLIDPYPTKDRERWEQLLDLIIEADMPVKLLIETRVEDIVRDEDILPKYRQAGIIHLYLGTETSTDEMLQSLNKGTDIDTNKRALDLARENDIMTEASFMIGSIHETWDSIDKTIEVAIRLNPDIAVFPVLTPMPFTPIYEEMKERIRVTDYSQYNLATPIVEPYEMTIPEVTRALGKCYMRFYAQKMGQVLSLPDGFKRRYMLSAFEAMMKDYGSHFDFVGMGMPHPVPGMMGRKGGASDRRSSDRRKD